MKTVPCMLCGQEADLASFSSRYLHIPRYSCPNCGDYVVGENLKHSLRAGMEGERFQIACLAAERRLRGEKALWGVFEDDFKPTHTNIAEEIGCWWRLSDLLSQFPKPTEVIDRMLINLSRLTSSLVDSIEQSLRRFCLFCFCPERNLLRQLAMVEELRLITVEGISHSLAVTIRPEGWARIDELSRLQPESLHVFVAMWFNAEMDDFYRKGIEPAVSDAGFDCNRIDLQEHNNKICDEIVAAIRRSRFVVADFTGQRGGVYFEAGFAMGLGIPVIWTVRKDEIDKVHFDTRQYNHIVYETPDDLRARLYNRISATISGAR